MNINLAVVICTRNRPELLSVLLQSICDSKTKPQQINIVSSGIEIDEIVSNYCELLRINHFHTEKIGQSNQKVIAIQMIKEEIDWVLFLDDDLALLPDTIDRLLSRIDKIENMNVGGLGAKLITFDNTNSKVRKTEFVPLNGTGKIQSSGRAKKYNYDVLVETEWLNGASVWRKHLLQHYKLPILNSRYAGYEDVIFSSKIAESFKLIYDPEIRVLEQLSHANVKLNLSQFKYISLWTGYLVCSRLDTKIVSYKCLTIFRAVKFLLTGGFLQIVRTRKFIVFLKFISQIISLPMNKSKSKGIIIGLLEFESSLS
jgi:glycosyltransferase involved in cell wall biosynthesis